MPGSLPDVDKVEPVDRVLLDEFASECGLHQPFRVEVSLQGESAVQIHEFRQPFLLVGRRAESDLLLDHWLVSRRHAYLQLIDGRFYCVDLGSRTGTHGGDATERAGWVDPVQAIQIGPYSVRPELPALSEPADGPLPVVTWTISNRDEDPVQWTMNRGLALVGKSPACKIRLLGPEISRFHCGLVLTPSGVWAIDLLSQRSIQVNGEAVRFAHLRPGDELTIGSQVLVAHYDLTGIKPLPSSSPRAQPSTTLPPAISSNSPDPAVDRLPALIPTVIPPNPFWTPLAPISPPEEAGSRAIDPTVDHLVQKFGAMQQQMFDQFHQTMMMMFEGFAALHRETSSSIKEELAEVRRLSAEMEALREETSRLAEATTMSFQAPAFLKADQHLEAKPALGGQERDLGLNPKPEPSAKVPPRMVPPLPDEAHGDLHAQLCERLNSIANERQTRWQKILAMMAKA